MKLKENIVKLVKDFNKLQYLFFSTSIATSIVVPYLFPYSNRKINENDERKNVKFTTSEYISAYSGAILGTSLIISQAILYYKYGIEQKNYEVFAIPFITNLSSLLYENIRKRNLESKLK